jgi:hypothetical protein
MQFLPAFCQFLSQRFKFSLQRPVLKHPQSVFFCCCESMNITGDIFIFYTKTGSSIKVCGNALVELYVFQIYQSNAIIFCCNV